MPTAIEGMFGSERLLYGADRTLYWPARRILFAADLHAGKAAHMRRYGLAVPAGNVQADLTLLRSAALKNGAVRLIFLGDLFHSETNNEWDIFEAWCRQQPFAVELVRGNHDRFLSDGQLAAAGITVFDEPHQEGPFELRHHPVLSTGRPVLCGHLHPVIRTEGPARDRLRLACFWQQADQLVLPALGSATGGLVIKPGRDDKIYSCAADTSTIIRVY